MCSYVMHGPNVMTKTIGEKTGENNTINEDNNLISGCITVLKTKTYEDANRHIQYTITQAHAVSW